MALVAVGVDFAAEWRLLKFLQLLFVAPKIFLVRLLFLTACYGSPQQFKKVVKLPKERGQMGAANQHINLGLIPKRLLLFSQLIWVGLQGSRLQIKTDIGQMV